MGRKTILICSVLLLALGACKPTEKNYREAYDSAIGKRNAEKTEDAALLLPSGTVLQSMDSPVSGKAANGKLNVAGTRFKYAGEGEDPDIRRYNAAVSRYKMPTNALAQAKDLSKEGFKAFPAEGVDGWFYVVAGSFDTLDEATAFVESWGNGKKERVTVGLPEGVLILER